MATAVFGGSNRHARSGSGSESVEQRDGDVTLSGGTATIDESRSNTADSAAVGAIDGSANTFDPSSYTPEPDAPFGRFANGNPRKRPVGGRTATSGGGSNRTRSGSGKSDTSKATGDLTKLLHSLHMMGATFLSIPQLELDESEADKIAAAVARVTDLYDVPMMSEEARAWTNLAMVTGTVYGPRFLSYTLDKKPKKQNAPVTVITPASIQ